jgi:hypothetical protein
VNIASPIRLVITALVLTLLSPFSATAPAQATETVLKTVTVKGHDGALLNGASVLITTYREDGSGDLSFISGTTNSQGVATIAVPVGSSGNISVAPSVSDLQNAIYADTQGEISKFGPDSNEPIEINLEKANIRFVLKYSNGTDAEKGMIFILRDTNNLFLGSGMIARAGAFGFALPSDLTPGADYNVGYALYQEDVYENKSLFSFQYGLRAAGAAGSQTYKVFTDRLFTTEIVANSDGVFPLVVTTGNIVGQLKDGNGNNLALPNGVRGQVTIQKINSDGSLDSNAQIFRGAGGSHFIYPDGSFPGRVLGNLAGRYRVSVTIQGSSTIPSFRSYIYQNANGEFSTAEGSGYLPTPFALNLTVPSTPTLKIRSFLPGTSTPDDSINIEYSSTGVGSDMGSDDISTYPTGEASIFLPNGTYTFDVSSSKSADNGYDKKNVYTVVVSGGVTTSVTLGSTTISASSDGFYNFEGRSANLKLALSDSATGAAINDFSSEIFLNSGGDEFGDYVTSAGSNNGLSRIIIEPGNYVLLINPHTPGYSQQRFLLTVGSDLVPSITGVTPAAGVFTLPMKIANAKVQYRANGNPTSAGWVEFCQGPSEYEFDSCEGSGFGNLGRAYKNLEPGNYYLIVRPGSSEFAPKKYNATVDSQGVLTVAGSTLVDGHWQLTGQTPNVRFKVLHPITGNPVSSGWINIQKVASDGSYLYSLLNADLSSSEPGLTSSYVPDGNYVVIVNPNSKGDASVAGLASKRYVMTVVSGVASISVGGAAVAKDGEKWIVTLANANLSIKLKTPTGGVLTSSWFDLCTDTGNGPSQVGSCSGQGVNQDGEGSLNVEPGNYYLRVNPGSSLPYAQKTYAVSVASDGTVTITDAVKIGDFWHVAAAAPNFTGKIRGPIGETLTVANNQGFDLQLQKWDSDRNYWGHVSGQWRNSADFAFNVTAAGKYRLSVNPRGFAQYTTTISDLFWVNGTGQVATSETGTYGLALSNFDIRVKTPNFLIDFVDPRDNSLLSNGWISAFSVDTLTNNQQWIGNGDISSANPGKIGFNFADGTYRLEVNPSAARSGLTRKQYKVVVASNGTSVVVTGWKNNTEVTKTGSRFVISAGKANITGRVTAPDGTPLGNVPNTYTQINVQKLNAGGNWDWTDNWYSTDGDGYFNVNVEDPGTYRLRVEPYGRQNVTVAFSDQFTVTNENAATFELAINPLKLNAPDLLVSVYEGDSPTAVSNIGIEIRRNDQWFDWANTGQTGVGGISFVDAGNYQLVLHPNTQQTQNGFTRQTYDVVVTINSGVKTATVTPKNGASKVGNLNKLKLGTAALSGRLLLPASGSNAVVANANVVPITATGQELWQYSSNTSATGKWAISLPAGTYKLQARTPYGLGTYGNGEKLGTVTIASDGTATLSGALNGLDPLNLTLTLKDPTWRGTVLAPGSSTDPIPFASVCIVITGNWNCSQANQQGQWAISAPSDFTAFDTTAEFRIEDVQNRLYPTLTVRGASEVLAALGGTSSADRIYRLPSANVQITVTAGGEPASGIWANLEEVNIGWLGANMTDASGVAKFYVDPSKLDGELLRVRAEINGNPKYATGYASSQLDFSGTGGEISRTLPLSVPNLRAILSEPSVGGVAGAAVPYSWVELLKENGQGWDEWVSGTSTDSQGQFSLFAPTINSAETKYIVRVNPPWNNSSTSSSRDYAVTVNSGGSVQSIVVRNKTSVVMQQANINGFDYWKLTLAAPTLSGSVLDSVGQPIANSWVSPYDQINQIWMSGVNSRSTGAFSMALNDGMYRIEANVPWGVTNTARSAQCLVTLSGGAVISGGACVQPDKTVQLRLRAPNVTFTLKSGGEVVPYAHIGIGFGSWNTWAQSDVNGKVSLFVDSEAIASANPGISGEVTPYLWIDPPWNANNKMVRWDCPIGANKPICSQLPLVTIGTAYAQSDLGDIQVLKPNTVLAVKVPGGSASIGAGAWVTLVSFDQGSGANQTWAGANTDSSGNAYFYLDSSTATADTRWGVTINPPWDKRHLYSMKEFGTYQEHGDWTHGLTWSELLTTAFAPATPNFAITVNRPTGGTPNRYGWVQLEEVDSNGNTISWKNGTSLDYLGRSSLLLAAGKIYRLTAYPNGGEGARTTCVIQTDTSTPIAFAKSDGLCDGNLSGSSLVLTLDQGNVTGTVKDSAIPASPVAGAIVVAVANDSTTITTTTNENGRFGLDLDLTKSWRVTVIPSGTTLANQTLTAEITTAGDIPTIFLANR